MFYERIQAGMETVRVTENRRKRKLQFPVAVSAKRRVPWNYLATRGEYFACRASLDSMHHLAVAKRKRNFKNLSPVIKNFYKEYRKGTYFLKERHKLIRRQIFQCLNEIYHDVDVYMVGSYVTDLAHKSSGLDLVAIIKKSDCNEHLKLLRNIENLVKRLEFATDVRVKNEDYECAHIAFIDSVSGVEVSIKVDKRTSVLSTALVKTYTRIDERVAPLIFVVKSLAHDIGIYRDRFLNGYTLSLMAIHFLQSGCCPEVLPRSLSINDVNEEFDLTRFNVYQPLPPFKSKNCETVGELLISYVDYYGYKFSFDKEVVSIRTRPVMKAKNTKLMEDEVEYPLYVEEPFSHTNTASAIDSTAMNTIHMAFKRTLHKLSVTQRLDSILNGF